MFGLERSPGVTDIVLGRMRWEEAVKDVSDVLMGCLRLEDIMKVPGFDNLHIITCGDVPPNPSEMLNSSRIDAFLEEAKERYDMVLMDSPPVLPVSDAAVLARKVDGVMLVYEVGRTPRNALGRAKTHLDSVQARVLGTVLNGVKASITGFSPGTQYYIRYYGEEEAGIIPTPAPRRSWWDRIRGRRPKRVVPEERPTVAVPEETTAPSPLGEEDHPEAVG